MANFSRKSFGLVFQGFRSPPLPKNTRPKSTPKNRRHSLQFHLLEPQNCSRRVSAMSLGKRKHTQSPAPVRNFSLPAKNWGPKREDFGGTYGFPDFYRVFHHWRGKFFYEAKKVVQKIFFRWWSCTLSSSLC